MVLTAPLFGGTGTPVLVRILFALGLSLCLAPILYGTQPIPADAYELLWMAIKECASGVLLGVCVQMVLLAAEMAGAFLDSQVGFSLASVLYPNSALPSSVLGRFKFLMALVLMVSMNGHHLMIGALVKSYETTNGITAATGFDSLMHGVTSMSMLAIQIAAPVAAVAFVVDAVLGIVSRAVPQINVLMAGISGKLLVGMVTMTFALPALAVGVQRGLEISTEMLLKLMGGA
jgi:flagellar biosynthetic protein FliR